MDITKCTWKVVRPEGQNENNPLGKNAFRPSILIIDDGKGPKPLSAVKPKPPDFVPIKIDWDKEYKKLESSLEQELSTTKSSMAERQKRQREHSSSKNSMKKRKLITAPSYTSNKLKPESNFTGSNPRVKKNLFGYFYREPQAILPMVNKPHINHTENLEKQPDLEPLPDLDGSSCELFEISEKECGILKLKPPAAVSPLSSITSRLNSTSISNSTSDIQRLKMEISNYIEVYTKDFTLKMTKMKQLQNELESDKENFISELNRKLELLDEKNKSCKLNGAVVKSVTRTTPKACKNDLRIATLHKNMQKSGKKDNKMEKAVNCYNNIRGYNPAVLNTPTTNRKELLGLNQKNVSVMLQQQCLMMMDTPVHK